MDCLKEDETNLGRNTNSNTNRKVTNAETFIPCPSTNIKGRKYANSPREVIKFTFKSWKTLS